MPETVQQLLRQRRYDDTPALAYGERTWTWRQHLAEAEAEAAAEGGSTNYSSQAGGDTTDSAGSLASDEQLAALREKLSGGA